MGVSTYGELREHIGHNIVCVAYGNQGEDPLNVAIECEDCGLVILDFNKPEEKPVKGVVCGDGCTSVLPLKVCSSAAGYYIGRWCDKCGPYERVSDYFGNTEAARLEAERQLPDWRRNIDGED